MNRGCSSQRIFHSPVYYHTFLTTLAGAHERFGIMIHGCLMGNRYHPLFHTSHGNLGRAMRYINDVYTQQYNRLKHTDGPLFRGRYQDILAEKDRYFLPLSCYIHRNIIETKPPPVRSLDTYLWSSFPPYINHTNAPTWLHRELIYEMLGHHPKCHGFRTYVKLGLDDEVKEFYDRSPMAAVLGKQEFINWVREDKLPEVKDKFLVARVLPGTLSVAPIIRLVTEYNQAEPAVLTEIVKGPKIGLVAR